MSSQSLDSELKFVVFSLVGTGGLAGTATEDRRRESWQWHLVTFCPRSCKFARDRDLLSAITRKLFLCLGWAFYLLYSFGEAQF